MTNLGDMIAFPAQFLARGFDRVLGTDIANCSGCKKMQSNLNAGMSITDAVYERWFKSKQQGEKMKYQVVVIIEGDKISEVVAKAEALGEVLAVQARPESPIQRQVTPGK